MSKMQDRFEISVLSNEEISRKVDLTRDLDSYSADTTKLLFFGFCMGAKWVVETFGEEA